MRGRKSRCQLAVSLMSIMIFGAHVHAAELGGVKLEAPVFSAVMLHNDGCRRIEKTDDADRQAVDAIYNKLALTLVWIDVSQTSKRYGVEPFTLLAQDVIEETFLCKDRRYYLITSERAGEQRVIGVTLLYCSGDETAGVEVLYDKLGIEKPEGVQGNGVPEFSLFVDGEKGLQKSVDPFAPNVPDNIAVTAYRDPAGCRGAGHGDVFMFGLSYASKSIYAEVAARNKARKAHELEAIKPPPRL